MRKKNVLVLGILENTKGYLGFFKQKDGINKKYGVFLKCHHMIN